MKRDENFSSLLEKEAIRSLVHQCIDKHGDITEAYLMYKLHISFKKAKLYIDLFTE